MMEELRLLNLLYIEDNIKTQINYSKTFELIFNMVFVASNYEEALIKYRTKKIDLLLVDIELNSEKNGFDIANKVRELNKNIPIVFLTGHDEKEFILNAINSGMNGYITKPLDLEKLSKITKNLFQNKEEKHLIKFNGLIYNTNTFELFDINNKNIYLGKKENQLLQIFLKNKNKLLSREMLEYTIWKELLSSDGTLKNLIASLRKKIGKDTIVNISKLGWKIKID